MARVGALVATLGLVACGGPPTSTATRHASGRLPSPPAPLIHAPPAGQMQLVAVTADGGAAFTDDADGNGRLWPALDGTLEPVVVDLPAAHAAAIARAGDGFRVAIVDDAGGIVIDGFERDGRRDARADAHAAVAPDPVVRELVAVDAGLLVRRADHSLALIDWQGRRVARLAANAGEQLLRLAGNGHDAVVAIGGHDGVQLRRIAVAAGAVSWDDAMGTGGELIALSPSGDRAVVAVTRGLPANQIRVTDRRGKLLGKTSLRPVFAIGFLDDSHVVAYTADGLSLVGLDGKVARRPLATDPRDGRAITGGVAIAAVDTELAVSTLHDDSFVGYDVLAPTTLAAGSGGTLMISAPTGSELLDRDLAPIPGAGVAPDGNPASLLQHLAGDDWLVATDQREGVATTFYVAHGSAATALAPGTLAPGIVDVEFEPSTSLLATTSTVSRRVLRYDPVAHSLRTERALAQRSNVLGQTVKTTPLAPDLAGGMRLATIEQTDDTTVRWFDDEAETKPTSTVRVAAVYAIDRAGHAFTADSDPMMITVFDRTGKRLDTLPRHRQATEIVVNRDGSRIAQIGIDGIYLDDMTGKPVWHSPVVASVYPLWLDDGAFAVPTRTGIARLDGRTGAVQAMRCSWGFGRTAKPHHQAAAGESMCELVQRGQSPWPRPPIRAELDLDE